MNYSYGEKRTGADKLALLGLFIASLMIAKMVVTIKSAIRLSAPITLGSSGLSVAMPLDKGWNLENSWIRSDNDFFIQSFFAITSPTRPSIRVRCRYLLTGPAESAAVQFGYKAAEHAGKVSKTGRITADAITVDWAYIENAPRASDIIFGIASLPAGRQLNIEVEHLPLEFDTSMRAFEKVARNIRFEDNQLLKTGRAIVAELKEMGLHSFLGARYARGLYLISDQSRTPVGFTTDLIVDSGSGEAFNIRAASYLYFRGQNAREQLTFFQGDARLDEFVWKNQTLDRTGVHHCQMTLRKDGVLTLVEFAPQIRQRMHRLGPAAIPEVFLEQLLGRMIDTGREKIVVDIIQAAGRITPIVFTLIEPRQENSPSAAYVIEAAFMQENRPFEHIYLDKNRSIITRAAVPDGSYVLRRESEQNVLRYFPERAEYILAKNKLLEQYQQ